MGPPLHLRSNLFLQPTDKVSDKASFVALTYIMSVLKVNVDRVFLDQDFVNWWQIKAGKK